MMTPKLTGNACHCSVNGVCKARNATGYFHPMRMISINALLLWCLGVNAQGWRETPFPPKQVSVRPVFLVPQGAPQPTADQSAALLRHIQKAQDRYKEMLLGITTFSLESTIAVLPLSRPVNFYRNQAEDGVPEMTGEVLDHLKVSRFSCPWVFVMILINPSDQYPSGGGRPINGGINSGGGVVVMSSFALDGNRNFQSTLQHELGHAFGLPHVDSYGRNMQNDSSLMSYNPKHHTNGYSTAERPGVLVSQDIAALAKNKSIFPDLRIEMTGNEITLGPMEIPGHPSATPKVTTSDGETYSSAVARIFQREVIASVGPGLTYNNLRMWHSRTSQTGWVGLNIEFPVDIALSRIRLHTQHSGIYHIATQARIYTVAADGSKQQILDQPLMAADAEVIFPRTENKRWRIELKAGESMQVVVRGIRFFDKDNEVIMGQN